MMVILEVYTKHIKVKYKSTLLSKAVFFVVLCGMFTIIFPFIFAFKSGGFWLKRDVFYEQPKINLKGEYLFMATTTNISNPVICSTFSYYKQKVAILDVCSIIKLREIDNNFDNRIDKLSLNIDVNILENKLTSINLVLPIKYKLTTVCPLEMQSAIIFQHYFHGTQSSDLQIVADLAFFQSGPIKCKGKDIHNFYNYSVIENNDDDDDYELATMIERYAERNVSTHLTNVYTNVISGNKEEFRFSLLVRYPEHKIYYKPGFWQIMKWAWIQYFAVYIVIAWFVGKIKSYVFNNRLVLAYEDNPLNRISKNK